MEKNKYYERGVLPNGEVMYFTVLSDDAEIKCEILTIFEVNNKNYIALLPLRPDGEPDEEEGIYLYGYEEDADMNGSLLDITDDEEYELVDERFDELLDEAAYEEIQ